MTNERSAGAAVLGLGVCVVLGSLSAASYSPPAPVAASAPETEFSAERAATTVAAIARRPRTLGSEAHAAARRHLIEVLDELGLETEVEESTVLRARGHRLRGARVANVIARLRGTGRPGAILLMAHYDSVPGSPGAGDDASGVAAIVEALRAITAGPPLARDLLVLLTDGEEAGLLGARAFVRDRARLDEIALVLNFEARGGGGAVSMFESSAGNHRLVRALGRAASWPVASSLSYEVYRRMPNDTDFSVLRRAGLEGLNFAMIGRYPSYHTSLDTVERLAPGSLQHHGSYALALARHFGEAAELPAAGADGVYFNLFGRHGFVGYSSHIARLLAVLLALVAGAVATIGGRRRQGRAAGTGWGVLFFVGAMASGLAAGVAIWRGLLFLGPGLRHAPHGVPWIEGWLALAGALLTLALVTALVRLAAGLARPADLWAGALAAWSALAIGTSFLLPGASYVFLWPALAGWLALSATERFAAARRWRGAVAAVAALPAAVLLAPVLRQLLAALTVRQAGPALALLAALATLLTLPLAELTRRWRNWIETGLAGAALGVLAVAVWTAAPTPLTPATSELSYALDADLKRGYWVSGDPRPSPWALGFVGAGVEPGSVADLVPGARRAARRGAAPALALAPPVARVEALDGEPSLLRLRLRSQRGAPVLHAFLHADAPFRLARVGGAAPPPELRATAAGGARELELTFFAPPAGGLEIEIEPGPGRLELHLADRVYGLPEIDGVTPRRPATLIAPASWTSDSTVVSRHIVWPRAAAAKPDAAGAEADGDV